MTTESNDDGFPGEGGGLRHRQQAGETTRQQAAVYLAHAEAAVVRARGMLREAVKAEIDAMPEVGDGEGFHAKVAALAVVLGVPEIIEDTDDQTAYWTCAPSGQVSLSTWHGGPRMAACVAGDGANGGEWRLTDHTLDTALRLALGWLADRDVFVEVRR